MSSLQILKYKKLGILRVALFFYALPLLSFGIFIIDHFSFQQTDMLFWVIFLISLSPCGFIGLTLTIIGIITSSKQGIKNQTTTAIMILPGLLYIVGGLLGLMLIYVVVGQ
jgi:drug/metabolite transporter (DMT)-like permease